MDLSIVVPCYNEADNIHLLVDELLPVLQGDILRVKTDSNREPGSNIC